jgi:uncharacterized protein (DUF2141 family)
MLKNTKFDFPLILLAALALPVAANAEETPDLHASLTVQIWNIQNDEGQIGCSLYASEEGFPSKPEKAAKRIFVKQQAGKATCTFKGVKPGTYAVSVMHDADSNGELKTNMVGRPKEWWGVSNDVPAERFGPPKYEKATFKLTGAPKIVKVKLQL